MRMTSQASARFALNIACQLCRRTQISSPPPLWCPQQHTLHAHGRQPPVGVGLHPGAAHARLAAHNRRQLVDLGLGGQMPHDNKPVVVAGRRIVGFLCQECRGAQLRARWHQVIQVCDAARPAKFLEKFQWEILLGKEGQCRQVTALKLSTRGVCMAKHVGAAPDFQQAVCTGAVPACAAAD